jgi:hypothetical protein
MLSSTCGGGATRGRRPQSAAVLAVSRGPGLGPASGGWRRQCGGRAAEATSPLAAAAVAKRPLSNCDGRSSRVVDAPACWTKPSNTDVTVSVVQRTATCPRLTAARRAGHWRRWPLRQPRCNCSISSCSGAALGGYAAAELTVRGENRLTRRAARQGGHEWFVQRWRDGGHLSVAASRGSSLCFCTLQQLILHTPTGAVQVDACLWQTELAFAPAAARLQDVGRLPAAGLRALPGRRAPRSPFTKRRLNGATRATNTGNARLTHRSPRLGRAAT